MRGASLLGKGFCASAALAMLICGGATPAYYVFKYNQFEKRPDAWFASAEGRKAADNLLTYQAPSGGWPKNIDMTARPAGKDPGEPTIDNSATHSQMRFLARSYNATHDERYKASFLKGLDYLLKMQYPNGGWPQFYPLRGGYSNDITFNDDAMASVMALLRDVTRDKAFDFVNAKRREDCQKAFDKGVECILKCQIVVDGKKTAWCQQHDKTTLKPSKARAYELPSITPIESTGIVLLLMSIDKPSPAVRESINNAVAWMEKSAIHRVRVEATKNDRVVIPDPQAPPVWARYYEIGTNRPFFCGRDGVKKYDLKEIGRERRAGYAWYGTQPSKALAAYGKWKERVGEK